jgi:Major Facilitator Superfamily
VLLVTNVAQALAVTLLLLSVNGATLWPVYAAGMIASTLQSFSEPAESSLLPSLVGPKDLVAANALNALNNRLGRLLGLPMGAAVLAGFGLSGVVIVDCGSFAAAAGVVAVISSGAGRARPADEPPVGGKARSALVHFWQEWLGGIGLISRERSIALVFFVLGLMTYGGTMLDPLSPGWVRAVLGAGPAAYAGLLVAHAVGGIVGSLSIGMLGRRLTPRHLMGWCSIIASVLLLVRFNVPVLWLALVLSLCNGATSVAAAVGVDTVVQQSIPDRYRGRVFGSLGATGALLSLLGALTGGVLGQLVGIVPALDLASGLVGLAGVVVLVVYAGDQEPADMVST